MLSIVCSAYPLLPHEHFPIVITLLLGLLVELVLGLGVGSQEWGWMSKPFEGVMGLNWEMGSWSKVPRLGTWGPNYYQYTLAMNGRTTVSSHSRTRHRKTGFIDRGSALENISRPSVVENTL